jgi:putative PEP-CTERM system histidine kinase
MRPTVILAFTGALVCCSLAAIMLRREARSFVAWAFAIGMLLLALEAVFSGISVQAETYHEVLWWQRARLVVMAILPGVWLLFCLSFARENYREFLRTWRWGIASAFAIPLLIVAGGFSSLFVDMPFFEDGARWSLGLGWAGQGLFLSVLIGAACLLMNLERTLQASIGILRWRIKFMILGIGSIFAVRVYTGSQILLFSRLTTTSETIHAGALVISALMIGYAFSRLRFLDVNLYLSQTALYHSLSIVVMGAYLLLIGVLAKVVSYIGGEDSLPLEALFVFATCVGFILFWMSDEWKIRSRLFISRHLHRPRYDYRKEWMLFTERTTSLLESKALCDAVIKMVSETFGVACVTIWLLDDSHEKLLLGGSTVFSEIQTHDLQLLTTKAGTALIHFMRDQRFPIDCESLHGEGSEEFAREYAPYMRQAQIRFCVPLIADRELLALMTLNERIIREPLSMEDIDLLKTIADQTASRLSHIKLAHQLLKAKELEAFQTLSTFFIHDLKNLASTLSLTMQNLPVYFDDPEFRDDALRVMTNSVQKINSMCSRLSTLTKGLDLQKEAVDLNALVTETLTELDGAVHGELTQELHALPMLYLDRSQIQKVLVNLVLNAQEAIGPQGSIAVSTAQQHDWAIMAVKDNGSGMRKDFIEKSLFHPFRTTKSKGLGIGLFHSQKIVEAHRGRIEVESELGKGSTFRVLLPMVE